MSSHESGTPFGIKRYEQDVVDKANPFVFTIAKLFKLDIVEDYRKSLANPADPASTAAVENGQNEHVHKKAIVAALAKSLELWTPNILHAPYGHMEASNWFKSAIEVSLPAIGMLAGAPLLPAYLVSRAVVIGARSIHLGESLHMTIDRINPFRKKDPEEKATLKREKDARLEMRKAQLDVLTKRANAESIKILMRRPRYQMGDDEAKIKEDLKAAEGALGRAQTELKQRREAYNQLRQETSSLFRARYAEKYNDRDWHLKDRLLARLKARTEPKKNPDIELLKARYEAIAKKAESADSDFSLVSQAYKDLIEPLVNVHNQLELDKVRAGLTGKFDNIAGQTHASGVRNKYSLAAIELVQSMLEVKSLPIEEIYVQSLRGRVDIFESITALYDMRLQQIPKPKANAIIEAPVGLTAEEITDLVKGNGDLAFVDKIAQAFKILDSNLTGDLHLKGAEDLLRELRVKARNMIEFGELLESKIAFTKDKSAAHAASNVGFITDSKLQRRLEKLQEFATVLKDVLENEVDLVKKCSKCGAIVEASVTVCPNCGNKLMVLA